MRTIINSLLALVLSLAAHESAFSQHEAANSPGTDVDDATWTFGGTLLFGLSRRNGEIWAKERYDLTGSPREWDISSDDSLLRFTNTFGSYALELETSRRIVGDLYGELTLGIGSRGYGTSYGLSDSSRFELFYPGDVCHAWSATFLHAAGLRRGCARGPDCSERQRRSGDPR